MKRERIKQNEKQNLFVAKEIERIHKIKIGKARQVMWLYDNPRFLPIDGWDVYISTRDGYTAYYVSAQAYVD